MASPAWILMLEPERRSYCSDPYQSLRYFGPSQAVAVGRSRALRPVRPLAAPRTISDAVSMVADRARTSGERGNLLHRPCFHRAPRPLLAASASSEGNCNESAPIPGVVQALITARDRATEGALACGPSSHLESAAAPSKSKNFSYLRGSPARL